MSFLTSFLVLSLLLFGSPGAGAKANSCLQYYKSTAIQSEARNLEKYLHGPLGTSLKSTVKTVGTRGQKVIFVKDKDGVWVSKHNAVVDTLTAEGDIRLPIFLLGTELAAKLGYAIREIGNNQIEIHVPDAELLAQKIAEINTSLKSRGLEPITYLPIRAGFVTSKETMQMMLSAQGDYLVHFPYADKDLIIAPHEVSFHLGSILLSKKIIARSRIITEEFQSLIDLIDQHKEEIGPIASRLKGQLRIERNFEMDAGLASMVTSPGFTRRDGDMKSYSELLPKVTPRYMRYMIRNIEFLARPKMQPFEAVLTHLELTTGLDLKELMSDGDRRDFYSMTIPVARVGTKVEMDVQTLTVLKKIAVTYAARSRERYETGLPTVWLSEFLNTIDKRIKDISDSLD